MGKISPFAPKHVPQLPAIEGVRIATAAAGIRYPGRTDLLLALFDPGTTVAGVLTKSKTASAPVDWCRAHLAHGMARALVVNSGNSNAFTGKRGKEAVKLTAEAAASSRRLPRGGRLYRFDRGDWRAARCAQDRQAPWPAGARGQGRRLSPMPRAPS